MVKLYDYTTGALAEVTPEFLADEYVMAHFIPQVPSAFALYAVLRAGGEIDVHMTCSVHDAIRLVALTALPGEVRK